MNIPAFPTKNEHYPNGEIEYGQKGMDLRDYFAAKAMAALLSHPEGVADWANEQLTEWAYQIADAMMEARKKESK